MIVKPEYKNVIDLDYMRSAIQKVLLSQGFRWSKTASKEKVELLFVKIPIHEDGNINFSAQKEISDRQRKVEEIKNSINIELSKITNTEVVYD